MRFIVQLKENIDGKILEDAVQKGMRKYPFYCVSLKLEEPEYVYEYNDLPIVVKEGDDVLEIGREQTNYHQVYFSYAEKRIYADISHTLTDGAGEINIIYSVMSFYLNEKYGEHFPECFPGSFVEGGVKESDYEDPLKQIPQLDKIPYVREELRVESFSIEKNVRAERMNVMYRFKSKEEPIVSYVKKLGCSPYALFALLANRAIYSVHKAEGIKCCVCINLRHALNAPRGHQNLTYIFILPHTKEISDKGMEEQLKAVHKIVKEDSDVSVQYERLGYRSHLIAECAKSSNLSERMKIIADEVFPKEWIPTSTVSYMRTGEFGAMSSYFDDMIVTSYLGGCLLVEVAALNGEFIFNFQQSISEDCYFEGYIKDLESLGFECTRLPAEQWKMPVCYVPRPDGYRGQDNKCKV